MLDSQRETDWFSLKLTILKEKTRDFHLNGGFEKTHDFRVKWGILEEKILGCLVKWGISKEKTRDFRLNVGFEKTRDFRLSVGFSERKRVIFA